MLRKRELRGSRMMQPQLFRRDSRIQMFEGCSRMNGELDVSRTGEGNLAVLDSDGEWSTVLSRDAGSPMAPDWEGGSLLGLDMD